MSFFAMAPIIMAIQGIVIVALLLYTAYLGIDLNKSKKLIEQAFEELMERDEQLMKNINKLYHQIQLKGSKSTSSAGKDISLKRSTKKPNHLSLVSKSKSLDSTKDQV